MVKLDEIDVSTLEVLQRKLQLDLIISRVVTSRRSEVLDEL